MQIAIAAQAAALNARANERIRDAYANPEPEFSMTLAEFIEEADKAGHSSDESVSCAFCNKLRARLQPIISQVLQQQQQVAG